MKSVSVLADFLHVTDMPSRTHSLQGHQGREWEGQKKTLTDNTHYFHLSPLAPHGPNLTAREAGKCRWWQTYGECLLPRPHSYSQLFSFPWGGTYSKSRALSPFTLLPCFEGGGGNSATGSFGRRNWTCWHNPSLASILWGCIWEHRVQSLRWFSGLQVGLKKDAPNTLRSARPCAGPECTRMDEKLILFWGWVLGKPFPLFLVALHPQWCLSTITVMC